MLVERFLADYTLPQLRQLTNDHEILTRDGQIGDCCLRNCAKTLLKEHGIDDAIVLWMNLIAFEAYKRQAKAYWDGGGT